MYSSQTNKKHLGLVLQKIFVLEAVVWMIILGPYLHTLDVISWVVSKIDITLENKHFINSTDNSYNGTQLDSTVHSIASQFIYQTCYWGILDFCMRLLTKYLSLQYLSKPIYVSSALLISLHVSLSYYFSIYRKQSLDGLILAGSLSRAISMFPLVAYCIYNVKDLAWNGFSTRVLYSWRPMILMGLSASLNVFSEMGMYELAIFLSQFRGIDYLSSVVIAFQIITLVYSTTYGVSYASSALIGSALGLADSKSIVKYIILCLCNTLVESIGLAVICYIFRYNLISWFTNDLNVTNETASFMWIILLEIPLDHIQTLFSYGILITVGYQAYVATALAVICYGICTPVMFSLIFFTNLNGQGVLWGMMLFVFLNTLVCGFKVLTLNIDNEVELCKDRVRKLMATEKNADESDADCLVEDRNSESALLGIGYFNARCQCRFIDLKLNFPKVAMFGILISFWGLYVVIKIVS